MLVKALAMEYNLTKVVYYEEVFSVCSFYYDRDVARSVQRKAAGADNKQQFRDNNSGDRDYGNGHGDNLRDDFQDDIS